MISGFSDFQIGEAFFKIDQANQAKKKRAHTQSDPELK